MTPFTIAAILVGMTLITYGLRVVPMLFTNPHERAQRVLKYVPVAVLSAISVPILVSPQGELALTLSNAYLVGGLAAITTAALSKKILPTIIVGGLVFVVVRFVLF
jgi:branched-subunit amino acid transport protein